MQALPFLERLVVSGLLFGEVGIALLESGEENGVFVSQSGDFVSKSRVLGLESSVFLAPSLGPSPCGGVLLVPPVQRLVFELLGLCPSTRAPRREIDAAL